MALKFSQLDGTNGFRLDGVATYDGSGTAVAGAGDLNGDGLDDVIIGAPNVGDAGAGHVVFGSAAGFPASLDLAALDGRGGFRLDAFPLDEIDLFAETGRSVAVAGDVNGDAIDDLIIGAPEARPSGVIAAGSVRLRCRLRGEPRSHHTRRHQRLPPRRDRVRLQRPLCRRRW